MEYNILFCSVGRRNELLLNAKKTIGQLGKIVATDCDSTAPALYAADKRYIVPKIEAEGYIDTLLDICHKENIKAITTLIDLEIEILAKHRMEFEAIGIKVLVPDEKTAKYCFDKYEMYQYLTEQKIPTVKTYSTLDDFKYDYKI